MPAAERREQVAGFQELAPDVFERGFEVGLGGPRRFTMYLATLD